MRRIFLTLTAVFLLFTLAPCAGAVQEAEENTASSKFIHGGLEDHAFLTDNLEPLGQVVTAPLYIYNPEGIGSIYLVLDQPASYVIRDMETGAETTGGTEGFLHCFTELESIFGTAPKRISLKFPDGATVCELRTYGSGSIPASVQRWEQPLNGAADMVLFSTHGDDEQLYFAGLLPYYAGEKELDVQVVYMTSHENVCGRERMHEMLNGLWAVGVNTYPVFGPFPDFKLDYREETYIEYEKLGYTRDQLLSYVVENLRRFRPQVAVGHDLNGEYGHGMHKVYADLLSKAVHISADAESFPESAEKYGTWDVPKTYLHLYKENQVTMDWDQPLDHFGGMTAFEVNQKLGFPCHITQQFDQYVYWLYGPGNTITQATQIRSWSPCYYGLYRSNVGEDILKNDLMENVIPYSEQMRQDEEEVQELRDTVSQARQEQVSAPQLLRQPEAVETLPPPVPEAPKKQGFPVLAGVLGLSTLAASVLLIKKYNKF